MQRNTAFAAPWWIFGLALAGGFAMAGVPNPTATDRRAHAATEVFFDDFNYPDANALARGGWIVRTEAGHPGMVGAQWGLEALRVVSDPHNPSNRLLQLEARTAGTGTSTRQAQICHARKYLEGTFAARVRFSDVPTQGPDGDVVIQSFYLVSPLRFAFDPEFSEVDWEYLPNGGWGDARTRLYGITWQTVQIEPWKAYNQAHEEFRSVGDWHTLVMQIGGGKTRHYLDGRMLAEHGGRNYPVVAMSLNFNLWFAPGGELPGVQSLRVYQQDVDWVYHAKDQLLSPDEVEKSVLRLRSEQVTSVDTVRPAVPPLANACDF